MQKIGSDQLTLYLAERSVSSKGAFHFVGSRLEDLQQVAVATFKILEDIGQLAGRRLGVERQDPVNDMVRTVLSVGLRSRGSVAGLNGRTTTLAGSGRRKRAWRFRNVTCDKAASARLGWISGNLSA